MSDINVVKSEVQADHTDRNFLLAIAMVIMIEVGVLLWLLF